MKSKPHACKLCPAHTCRKKHESQHLAALHARPLLLRAPLPAVVSAWEADKSKPPENVPPTSQARKLGSVPWPVPAAHAHATPRMAKRHSSDSCLQFEFKSCVSWHAACSGANALWQNFACGQASGHEGAAPCRLSACGQTAPLHCCPTAPTAASAHSAKAQRPRSGRPAAAQQGC